MINVKDFRFLFGNVGTTINYIGCFKGLPYFHGMMFEWYNDIIRQQLRLLKKFIMQEMNHQFKLEMAFFTQKDVNYIVKIADGMQDLEFVVLHFVVSVFCNKVQFEVIPLEAGVESDFLGILFRFRHSIVMLVVGFHHGSSTLELHIRWQAQESSHWFQCVRFVMYKRISVLVSHGEGGGISFFPRMVGAILGRQW